MTEAEALFCLGSFFGMYLLGWGLAYTIHVLKIFSEKI